MTNIQVTSVSLRSNILFGYAILMAVIGSMAVILLHERTWLGR